MKTKTIFNLLALALLMPALLLTTACSSDDDAIVNNNENNAKKGYTLPVTVNVTREGDGTRAVYNSEDKKLEFSSGDQLFVMGYDNSVGGAGYFAGTLTWVSEGTFTGTITTQNPYTGTAEDLFTAAPKSGSGYLDAILLPNGDYGYFTFMNSGYSTVISTDETKAFATSKATAVEQFSYEMVQYSNENSYSRGVALHPINAILNFTISGLSASSSVDVALTGPYSLNITGSVKTNASGEASFAVGVRGGIDFNNLALTVGGNDITLASGSKTLTAGKVYNVNRSVAPAVPTGAIDGLFSVSSTKQVYFSKGNLQAVCASADADGNTRETWTWQFASNQYEVGTANSAINGDGSVSTAGTVDLFCWSTSATYYGISTITDNTGLQGAFVDWGGNIGSGWYTLSKEEWDYLFSGRTNAASKYGHGSINGVNGMIILPDSWTLPDGLSFTSGNSSWTNSYTTAEWTQMESAGAVFLPAAGIHIGTGVYDVGNTGLYWSSSVYESNKVYAFRLSFDESSLFSSEEDKSQGCSVRLVKDAN